MALPSSRPKQSSGKFFKFQNGPNVIRFVSDLVDGESVRDKTGEKAKVIRSKEQGVLTNIGDQKVKLFWSGIIINRDLDGEIQLIDIDKASIINALIALDGDKNWGEITKYDITITKQTTPGEPLKTKYIVTPIPPKALTPDEKKAIKANPFDLEQIYIEGGKVFLDTDDHVADETPFDDGHGAPNEVAGAGAPPLPPAA